MTGGTLSALRFDPGTIELYTAGFCHVLALALHESLDTPIQILKGWQGGEIVVHVVVEDPTDPSMVFDVRGLRPQASVPEEWPDVIETWWEDAGPHDVHALIEAGELCELNEADLAEARIVAQQIVRHYFLERKRESLPRIA